MVDVGVCEEAVCWIVANHYLRPVTADYASQIPSQLQRVLQIAIGIAHKHKVRNTKDPACVTLLALSNLRQLRGSHLRVIASLVTLRHDHISDVAAGVAPLGHRPRGYELCIVRVSNNDHRRFRNGLELRWLHQNPHIEARANLWISQS